MGGVVISIDSRPRRTAPVRSENSVVPVTQARLAEGLQLHLEEMRVAQALREFRLQLDADLAAGSSIEGGELIYDSELKIVRRSRPDALVRG